MIVSKIIMKYILLISIFLLSLLNHTSFVYVPAVVMITWYASIRTSFFKLSKGEILVSIIYSLFILLSALYFLIFIDDVSEASEQSFTNNLFFSIVLFFIVFSISRVFKSEKGISDFTFAVKAVLIIHISAFFVQSAVVYATDFYIDFIEPITGEPSRYVNYITGAAMSSVLRYRATGLYVEPSTYASAITCLIMAAYALNINKKIIYIALLSLLLNFSTIGIILFVLVSIAIFSSKIRLVHVFLAVILITILLFIYNDLVSNFIDDFSYKLSKTSGTRFNLIEYIYLDAHGNIQLFGSGFFNIPPDLYTKITKDRTISALNDAGLMNFIVLKFGLISLLVVGYLFSKVKGGTLKLLFICVFISKISYVFPILYIAIVPALNKMRIDNAIMNRKQ